MPKLTEQDVTEHLDAWLVNFVPPSVKGGIEAVREKIRGLLTENVVGLAIPSVKVWTDYDNGQIVLFLYSSCTYLDCCRGSYLIDTRFWDQRPGGELPGGELPETE